MRVKKSLKQIHYVFHYQIVMEKEKPGSMEKFGVLTLKEMKN